jgi:hypothetical protein
MKINEAGDMKKEKKKERKEKKIKESFKTVSRF